MNTKEWKLKIQEIKDEVEHEYAMGGLSDGLYGYYAEEVAKRAVSFHTQEIREKVEGMKLVLNPVKDIPEEIVERTATYNQALTDVLQILESNE